MVSDVLKTATEILINANSKTSVSCARMEAGVILCHVLNKDRAFIYTDGDYEPEEREIREYYAKIRLRAEGMPIQHITGHQEFMSLDFIVNSDVLIPRGDTEILVESVIRHCNKHTSKEVRILDIGTGSGCIAVSLAHYIVSSSIVAVDFSLKALEVAKHNALKNKVEERIDFRQIDILEDSNEIEENFFDVVVSNPPYIDLEEMGQLQKEVKDFEPDSALYGGEDGLDFYRGIVEKAAKFLKPNGLLFFEVGYKQAKKVKKLMENGYKNIQIIQDLSQIERVVFATVISL